jgi:hypothetical protein
MLWVMAYLLGWAWWNKIGALYVSGYSLLGYHHLRD